MYSTQLRELTAPILDFQNLAKLLARRWRDYPVDRKQKDCRKVLGLLQKAVSESSDSVEDSTSKSKGEENEETSTQLTNDDDEAEFDWTKLGFETNDP